MSRQLRAAEPGQAPDTIKAGIDRVVVLGGKTYLTGELTVSPEEERRSTAVVWSKESGPGRVTFADARAMVTTAQCSELGDYVLKLTAARGASRQSSVLAVKVVAPPPEERLEPVEEQDLWGYDIFRSSAIGGPYSRINDQTVVDHCAFILGSQRDALEVVVVELAMDVRIFLSFGFATVAPVAH